MKTATTATKILFVSSAIPGAATFAPAIPGNSHIVSNILQCRPNCRQRICLHAHKSQQDESDNNSDDTSSSPSVSISLAQKNALALQQQAQKLRNEASQMRQTIEEEKKTKLALKTAKIDQWIDDLLIQYEIDDQTQLLNSVDQVLAVLRDGRFSQEQVFDIFNRICETGNESRSSCSPIMSLLVDAVGKLDAVERDENPNKRWTGKVERVLRKRLFAKDWGMDLEEDNDDANPWMLN